MDNCGPVGQYAGTCTSSGSIAGDHVDVGAETGGSGGSQASEGRDGSSEDDATSPAGNGCRPDVVCGLTANLVFPDLSLSDLASFYPSKPSVSAEPNGWAVIGLDTNFFSDAKTHTASGTLLGQSASVRFSPVGFHWEYGDGGKATTTSAGSSWQALGVPEFSRTATSHVYSTEGSYSVSLTVSYSAQYRVASGPWLDVPGTLTLSAPTFTVLASDAKTVLVQRDCLLDPGGPGC
ncbi:PKD domain-containing protein [Humibacter albus]|uniref:PKD domain-containing protein n=1 Tax=Humibacter albus TaxID=427754 RepID=UPI0003B59B61|nr:hypothetical protein [Humibacter albus]